MSPGKDSHCGSLRFTLLPAEEQTVFPCPGKVSSHLSDPPRAVPVAQPTCIEVSLVQLGNGVEQAGPLQSLIPSL